MSLTDLAISCFQWNRKISSRLTPVLARSPITPNQITTLSLVAGFAAAYFLSYGNRPGMLAGAFFLQSAFILDNCDGGVARLKSMQSQLGMWYDLTADVFVDFAVWTGLAFGMRAAGSGRAGFWLAAGACAGSLINYGRVAIGRLKGSSGKETPPAAEKFYSKILHVLSHDGDPSLLVWLLAAIGNPFYLLAAGACYINLIWIFAVLKKW